MSNIMIGTNRLIFLATQNLNPLDYPDLSTYEAALIHGVEDELSCYLHNHFTLLEIMQDIEYPVERLLRDMEKDPMTPAKQLIHQEAWIALVHNCPQLLKDIHKAALKAFSKTYTLTIKFKTPSEAAAQEVQNMWAKVEDELPEGVDYIRTTLSQL